MAVKEYKKIDLQTGQILDTVLFDVDKEYYNEDGSTYTLPLPEDYREGWKQDRQLHKPVYDFELGDWKETETDDNLLVFAKKIRDAELNISCKAEIEAGFDLAVNGTVYHFSYDTEAQLNYQDSYQLLQDGDITEETLYPRLNGDKVELTVDKQTMKDILKAGSQHKRDVLKKYRQTLAKEIRDAKTVDAVKAIQW